MTRLAIVLAVLALAACGQKGALYLPKPTSVTPTPTATDAPAEQPQPDDDKKAPAPAATPSEQVR